MPSRLSLLVFFHVLCETWKSLRFLLMSRLDWSRSNLIFTFFHSRSTQFSIVSTLLFSRWLILEASLVLDVSSVDSSSSVLASYVLGLSWSSMGASASNSSPCSSSMLRLVSMVIVSLSYESSSLVTKTTTWICSFGFFTVFPGSIPTPHS